MAEKLKLNGYENFENFLKEEEAKGDSAQKPTYILYTGSVNDDGKSWCPDCVKAEPIIEEGFKNAPEGSRLVIVEVGLRDEWKNPECPFRTVTKLTSVPTLTKFGTQKVLLESECADPELVGLLFED